MDAELGAAGADGAAGDENDLLAGAGKLGDLLCKVGELILVNRAVRGGDDFGAELDDDACCVLELGSGFGHACGLWGRF